MVRILISDIVAFEYRPSFEFSQRVPLLKLTALLVARFEDAAEMDSLSLAVGLANNLSALRDASFIPRSFPFCVAPTQRPMLPWPWEFEQPHRERQAWLLHRRAQRRPETRSA